MYLKRAIKENFTIIKGEHFPYRATDRSSCRYHAVIGAGGNVGDTKRIFEKLFWYLKRDRHLKLMQTSSILKNPPFGYLDQAFFYNAVLIISSDMQPRRLLRYLLEIENRFGRKRSFKDAPRTLDLDILFYEDRVIESEDLIIPHPEWYKRESVLIPLMEVNI